MVVEDGIPRGRKEGTVHPDPRPVPFDPEVHWQRFEELAGAFRRGEFARQNEDGSVTNVVSYERHVDPLDKGDLALLSEFRLRAAAAGLRRPSRRWCCPPPVLCAPGRLLLLRSPTLRTTR
jgi:hypothetical protein